jgi:glycosyltransferase involved in cell wall biosynthesis
MSAGPVLAPANRAPHIVMVVDNDVVADARVRKEAESLAAAGYRVTVVGTADEGLAAEERVGDARVVRVPVPRTVLEEMWDRRMRRRQRRLPLVGYRSRRAYQAARLRIQARRCDVEASAGRALARREAGPLGTVRFQLSALGRALNTAGLGAREVIIRGRGIFRQGMNRAARTAWQAWDGFVSRHETGARWRRVNPGLDDFEIAYGPIIDGLEPDVVHAHDVFSIGVGARAVARARLDGRRVAFVYDAHEYVPGLPKHASRAPRYAAAIESLEREYVRDADRIVTVSPVIAEAIKAHYGLDRMPAVVLNAPVTGAARGAGDSPAPSVRSAAGLDQGVPLLVYSGGLKRVRGIDIAVQAMEYLPGVHLAIVCVPHSRVTLAGELRAEAERRGVADRVHFLDPVPADEVVAFLASADVGVHPLLGVFPNHEMALPNKLFEYLHAGLAIVVTDLKELGRFVRRHGLGETFRSGDPADLAANVEKVLANPQPYRRAASDPELRAEYSWEHQAEELVAVYDDLLATYGAARGRA